MKRAPDIRGSEDDKYDSCGTYHKLLSLSKKSFLLNAY